MDNSDLIKAMNLLSSKLGNASKPRGNGYHNNNNNNNNGNQNRGQGKKKKFNRPDFRNELAGYKSKLMARNNGKDFSYEEIKAMFHSQDPEVVEDMVNLSKYQGKGALSSMERLVGEKQMLRLQSDYGSLPTHKKTECLQMALLDAFPALGQAIAGLAVQHGPKALSWLKDRAVEWWHNTGKAKTVEFIRPAMHKAINSVGIGQYLQSPSSGLHTLEAVDLDYLAAVICPEKYRARIPANMGRFTATYKGTATYPLKTNGFGNCAVYINLGAIMSTVQAAATTCFITTYRANDFDPVTGVQTTTAPEFTKGPLYNSAAELQRVVGESVRFVPLTSELQSQGSCQLAYWQDPLNFGVQSGIFVVPQSDMTHSPNYQSMGINSEGRCIYLPMDVTQPLASTVNNPGGCQYVYCLITGAEPNTTIYMMEISYCGEWIPTATSIDTTDFGAPGSKVLSQSCLAQLLSIFPELQHLTAEEAERVGAAIKTSPTDDYNSFLSYMVGHRKSGNYRSRPQKKNYGGLHAPADSFDNIEFAE